MDQTHLLDYYRQGGIIHKTVRDWLEGKTPGGPGQPILRPGLKLSLLANLIEGKVQGLVKSECNQNKSNNPGTNSPVLTVPPLNGGGGFPTGLSVNNCAAHWTPNPVNFGDPANLDRVLGENDLLKVDFGVHFNGCIIDAAFSYTPDPVLQPIIDASIEATTAGVRASGPDAILGEIGATIQEVIENTEVDIYGEIYQLHPIRDLSGHNIGPYKIHLDKAVPNIRMDRYQMRMKPGEIYAVETFPTTGSGRVKEDPNPLNCSHFMINYNQEASSKKRALRMLKKKPTVQSGIKTIQERYSTLAFCPRWLMRDDKNATKNATDSINSENNWPQILTTLTNSKLVNSYPALYDTPGSFVAQTEQTIAIREQGVEVLSGAI